jgi:hypothetical protein
VLFASDGTGLLATTLDLPHGGRIKVAEGFPVQRDLPDVLFHDGDPVGFLISLFTNQGVPL